MPQAITTSPISIQTAFNQAYSLIHQKIDTCGQFLAADQVDKLQNVVTEVENGLENLNVLGDMMIQQAK